MLEIDHISAPEDSPENTYREMTPAEDKQFRSDRYWARCAERKRRADERYWYRKRQERRKAGRAMAKRLHPPRLAGRKMVLKGKLTLLIKAIAMGREGVFNRNYLRSAIYLLPPGSPARFIVEDLASEKPFLAEYMDEN